MSSAFRAIGTLLKLGDGASPEVFTTVAELRNHDFELAQEEVDTTNHDSTNNYRERIVTFKNANCSFEGNFLPANATHDESTGYLGEYENQTLSNYQLIYSNAGNFTLSFAAYMMNVRLGSNFDDVGRVSGDLAVTGAVTMAQ